MGGERRVETPPRQPAERRRYITWCQGPREGGAQNAVEGGHRGGHWAIPHKRFYEKVIKVKADVAALRNLFADVSINVRW